MKRYLLFAGDVYYPLGGMNDLFGDFDSMDEAVAKMQATNDDHDWWHVYDTVGREIVDSG